MLRWTKPYFAIAAATPLKQKVRQSDILSFWFGTDVAGLIAANQLNAASTIQPNFALWFGGTPTIDEDIRNRFGGDVDAAINGEYNNWVEQDKFAALALIILLDQFALNIYRKDSASFEASKAAIPHTRHMIRQRWDAELPLPARLFVYLPLEHSETLADQADSVNLFKKAAEVELAAGRDATVATSLIQYAQEHYDVVAKYGRFPGRNELYNRVSTPEERHYLESGGIF